MIVQIQLLMNSCDMLNQQKQEIAQSVLDPSPHRGWDLGTRLGKSVANLNKNMAKPSIQTSCFVQL